MYILYTYYYNSVVRSSSLEYKASCKNVDLVCVYSFCNFFLHPIEITRWPIFFESITLRAS